MPPRNATLAKREFRPREAARIRRKIFDGYLTRGSL